MQHINNKFWTYFSFLVVKGLTVDSRVLRFIEIAQVLAMTDLEMSKV